MRLLCTNTSPFRVLALPTDGTCTPDRVLALVAPHVRGNGYINSLCLEFEGQHVPLVHEDELRLVSALMATYQQSCFEAGLSVSCAHTTKSAPKPVHV